MKQEEEDYDISQLYFSCFPLTDVSLFLSLELNTFLFAFNSISRHALVLERKRRWVYLVYKQPEAIL